MNDAPPNKVRTAPVSVRLHTELNARLDVLTLALDRPKSWIIEQAIRDYVAMQSWQLAAIDEGIAAADAGRLRAHEDVVDWVTSWGRKDELPVPE